ncbi:alpha-aminoadipic semialdehyde synthase, mitochondrial-like [Salvelinus alpinus]
MLPYGYHPVIAKHCITKKVNMVTASYPSPVMKDLQQSAEEAGITIVNEMCLDPGIDHMLAMEFIDQAKADGCTIESYSSFCGGLPALECSDNPLHYKFSWSPPQYHQSCHLPQGQQGTVVSILAGGTLMESTSPMDFMPGFHLECFPNRDSTKYGIEPVHTLIKGTLRFKGFSKSMSGFV